VATVRAADVVVSRLEEQVRELRAALEGAAEAICRIDLDGRILTVNGAFCRLFVLSPDEAAGRRWEELLVPEDRAAAGGDLDLVPTADKVEQERNALRPDGTTFPIQLAIVPVHEPAGGRTKGHYLFIHDLSERRRMENQLIFAGRMAAVGTLAAGVAHEINNPLAYIVANIDFVRHQMNTVASRLSRGTAAAPAHMLEETTEALTEARQGAERVRNIVRDLRVFARADDDQTGPVAVRRVLDSSINIAWNEIRHRARLVKDYGETPLVEGNESRLGQVFLNLLLNAAHAIPEGGTERNEIRVSTRTDARGQAVVEVRDSGTGIPLEIRDRIFDPFFTTKPVGEGTGLGLWICHGIVSALGGQVTLDSEIGRGSTFRVTLPAAAMDAPATFSTPTTPEVQAKGGRLLVIDDEPMILGALRRSLSSDYAVTCVADGRRALERLRAGERYEVILCDLMMPDLTGMDLYAELEKLAPEQAARMVFVSGGAFTPRAREFLERVPNARVEKPIDFQNLRVLLRNLAH
jgi:PAS domain S-box-containing protein